jgi:hypothetical protein
MVHDGGSRSASVHRSHQGGCHNLTYDPCLRSTRGDAHILYKRRRMSANRPRVAGCAIRAHYPARCAIRPYFCARCAIRVYLCARCAIRAYFRTRCAIRPHYRAGRPIHPHYRARDPIRPYVCAWYGNQTNPRSWCAIYACLRSWNGKRSHACTRLGMRAVFCSQRCAVRAAVCACRTVPACDRRRSCRAVMVPFGSHGDQRRRAQ